MIKYLVYFSVLSSLIGARVISFEIGGFQLSLFRATIILLTLLNVLEVLVKDRKIVLKSNKKNEFAIKFMVIWLLYAIITIAWVKDYQNWVRAVYFLSLGLLCVLLYNRYLKNSNQVIIALKSMGFMAIIHNAIGWYEVNTSNYLFLADERILRYIKYSHPVSMFGNTNNFATFLLVSIFVLYICIQNSNKIYIKLIYIITIISSLVLLILTKSRANILGVITGAMIFIFFSMKKRKTRRSILLLFVGIFGILVINPDVILNVFIDIRDSLYLGFSDRIGSDSVRVSLIKNGLQFLAQTLGFGTGAGNIEYWMINFAKYPTSGVNNIHNWWLEIMVGYGIGIFILYLIFYFKIIIDMLRKYRNSLNNKDTTISLGILCAMIGFIVGGISSSSNISSEWLWVFWSIVIAYQGIYNDKSVEQCKNKLLDIDSYSNVKE